MMQPKRTEDAQLQEQMQLMHENYSQKRTGFFFTDVSIRNLRFSGEQFLTERGVHDLPTSLGRS